MSRPTDRKIAVIGGGGVRTPLLVFGVNEAAGLLNCREMVLFDPDAKRLRIMAELGRAIVARETGELRVREATSIEDAVEGADVVIVLRIQRERQDAAFFPSMREYAVHYGLHPKHLERAAPDAIVMHPGPMNRGVEISSEIADGSRSLILDQVTNGVAVRMAVLYLLAGGGPEPVEEQPPAKKQKRERKVNHE